MGRGNQNPEATPKPDTSEQIYISSLALLKMLKHCRAGVPLEVMGLMLGEVIDDYAIKVVDVFAMPQSGTSVSVESVDPVYQQDMLDMLKQTQRNEVVVGWYHSHPSFGCWLSSVDINTQVPLSSPSNPSSSSTPSALQWWSTPSSQSAARWSSTPSVLSTPSWA